MAFIPVHPNCLIDHQTPIFTSKGWVPIGKIQVGDLVLTHKGRFRKVINVIITPKQRPKVIKFWINDGFKGFPNAKSLSLTSNHPVLTEVGWKFAEQLTIKDKILFLSAYCTNCNKPVPFYRPFCSWACASQATANKLWKIDGHKENVSKKVSKYMREEYASGRRDGFQTSIKAREGLKQKVEKQGYHQFQLPEVREIIREVTNLPKHKKAQSKKMKLNNPMYNRDAREKAGKARAKFYFENPEKHPNRIMAKRGRINSVEQKMSKLLKELGVLAEYQFPIRTIDRLYFVDFAIVDLNLVIEVDGIYWHRGKKISDLVRQTKIEKVGWQVLRFTDKQINTKLDKVRLELKRILANHSGDYAFIKTEILKIKKSGSMRGRTLYNLTVEEDESYIAKGFVIHNCRCDWLPVVRTISYPVKFYRAAGLIPPKKPTEPKVPKDKQDLITSGEITNIENLGGGANDSFIVDIKIKGKAGKGVYKPAAGERSLRRSIPEGAFYKREVAASWFDEKYFKTKLVPKTAVRSTPAFGKGSVQKFVENGRSLFMAEGAGVYGTQKSAREMVFIDLIMGNTDRHLGNVLINMKSKKYIAIDNGLAFSYTTKSNPFYLYRQGLHNKRYLGDLDMEGNLGWKLTDKMKNTLNVIIKDEKKIRAKLKTMLNDKVAIKRLSEDAQQYYDDYENGPIDAFFARVKQMRADGYIKEGFDYNSWWNR